MVGDAAYVGERLRDLDGQITRTSLLKVTSVLQELSVGLQKSAELATCDDRRSNRKG